MDRELRGLTPLSTERDWSSTEGNVKIIVRCVQEAETNKSHEADGPWITNLCLFVESKGIRVYSTVPYE